MMFLGGLGTRLANLFRFTQLTLKNQPNKIGTTPQYFYASCAFHQLCFVLVVLGMEGYGMSSTGCVVHVVYIHGN